MKPMPFHRLALCAVCLGFAFLLSLGAAAEPVIRPVDVPTPTGVALTADAFAWEGGALTSFTLSIANESTNLVTLDTARSTFTAPGAEPRALASVGAAGFAATIFPGQTLSGTVDVLAPLASGDRFTLTLVWTRGADADSATWRWEVVDLTPAAQPATEPVPQPQPQPAVVTVPTTVEASPETPAPTAGSDFVLGLIGIAAVVALLALVAWALWSFGGA